MSGLPPSLAAGGRLWESQLGWTVCTVQTSLAGWKGISCPSSHEVGVSTCFPIAHPRVSLPPFLTEDMGIFFLWSLTYQPSKAFQADRSCQSNASVRLFFFPS